MLDCLEKVRALSGFALLAHVDANSGLDVQVPGMSPHKVDILCHPALLGMELKRADSDIRYAEGDPDQARAEVGKVRRQRLGLGERQWLARLVNSDSHTLAALGRNAQGDRRVSRIKMAAPSFEALRQALEDAEARVRLEDKIPEAIPYVLGVAIEGGFLAGQKVQFSQNLNCIIGGRGAGKSTLFESVRCLAPDGSSSSIVDSEIWPVRLDLFWQDAAGQQHALTRALGGDVENVDDAFMGPNSFTIDSFGQSETAKISAQAQTNPVALLGYLDRFVNLESELSAEQEARSALLDLQAKVQEAQAQVDLIPQYERLLSVARQQLAALEKANAKEVIELQRRVSEERVVRARVLEKLGELRDEVTGASPKARLNELRQIADPATLHLGVPEFRAILNDASTFETNVEAAEGTIRTSLKTFQQAVQTQIAAWKVKDGEATRQIEEKRKELENQWDRRMGAAVISSRAWRIMAMAGLALSAGLALALTVVALQQRTFVHVVEVSPEGQVLNVRTASGEWRASEAQTAYHLGRFVRLVRTLPTDGVVLRENWLEAYKFLTPQAAAQLTEVARGDDPFLSLGRIGRTVHIRSIIKRSDQAWEVSWIERETNVTGSPDGQAFSGVFTVTTRRPRTADEIAANPLGLLISDFSWSRVR